MKIIAEGLFGSHLYGLSTPESDKDYKGVYVPDKREILLGRQKKSINLSTNQTNIKNTNEDVDRELYSLDYFVSQACKGETFAIDMLHMKDATKSRVLNASAWTFMVNNRTLFYSRNMKAFVGYAQRQAAKYSIKGSRLNYLEEVVTFLKTLDQDIKMFDVWHKLEENEFSKVDPLTTPHDTWWHVIGKKFNATTPISQVVDSLDAIRSSYGHRAKLARESKGVDWKAVSHAFRAAYQLRDIFTDGDFEYPLKETPFLLQVKKGELDFMTEVQGELEKVIEEVKILAEVSEYPYYVNTEFWDDFIVEVYDQQICW